jgi:hypothetical protein
MAPTLILNSNSVSNPQTINLSSFLRLQPDEGTDPAGPDFTQRVFARSLLKTGATLALEQNVEREWTFPLNIKGSSASVTNGTLVQQINQICESPGATMEWWDDGMSQPTYADILSGQVQVEYDYFKSQQAWCACKLLIFTQPFGRTVGPRPYAAASAAGPLLIISPYNSSGALAVSASTQAGAAGFGGAGYAGASGGIFYPGAPSLAGDAPAQIQLSFTSRMSGNGSVYAVSLLPDQNYNPYVTIQNAGGLGLSHAGAGLPVASVTSSSLFPGIFANGLLPITGLVPATWAGQHRLLAMARASGGGGTTGLTISGAGPGALPGGGSAYAPAIASVPGGQPWALYDMGTVTLHPSQPAPAQFTFATTASVAVDVNAVFMLPDANTMFAGQQWSNALNFQPAGIAYLDGIMGEVYSLQGSTNGWIPSPAAFSSFVANSNPDSTNNLRVTPVTRGLIPSPDPKTGMPIIAILVGSASSLGNQWTLSAEAAVLERARYVMS